MQLLLACAKIMRNSCERKILTCTQPTFAHEANTFAADMSVRPVDEIAQILHCNKAIAIQNKMRYLHFFDTENRMPAILAYNGQAFKGLKADTMTDADLAFARKHLFITSFLYGLLRPLDLISPYRMEGKAILAPGQGDNMFHFWKPRLTQMLIDAVKADDGVLVHLATEEMEHLFDWQRVLDEIKVIQPQFMVQKDGKLKTVVVYAKTCRGAMARHIIIHRIAEPSALNSFEFQGFVFNPQYGDEQHPHFVIE